MPPPSASIVAEGGGGFDVGARASQTWAHTAADAGRVDAAGLMAGSNDESV